MASKRIRKLFGERPEEVHVLSELAKFDKDGIAEVSMEAARVFAGCPGYEVLDDEDTEAEKAAAVEAALAIAEEAKVAAEVAKVADEEAAAVEAAAVEAEEAAALEAAEGEAAVPLKKVPPVKKPGGRK
jgi:hypothetical protein